MKKFLSVVSLLLVAAMLMATPIYVSAETASTTETTVSYGASADYAIQKGLPVHRVPGAYVTSGNNVDGVIGPNDPWYSSRSELTGVMYTNWMHLTSDLKLTAPVGTCEAAVIENTKYYIYVAQDADYIYVGIESPTYRTDTGSVLSRHNWLIAFGFDLDDYTKYLTLNSKGTEGYSYTNGTPGYTNTEGATKLSGTQVAAIVTSTNQSRYATENLDTKYYVGTNATTYIGQKLNTLDDNECCETVSYVEYKLSKQGLVDAGFMSAENKTTTKGMFLMIPDNSFRITNNTSLTNCGWGTGSPNARGVSELPDDIQTTLSNVSGKDTAFYFPTLFLFDNGVIAKNAPVNKLTYRAGQTVHHVTQAPAADIAADGVISEGEYGYTSGLVSYKNAFAGDNGYSVLQTLIDDYTKNVQGDSSIVNTDPDHSGVQKLVDMIESKKAQFWFAEDEGSIFIGIYDKGGYAKNDQGSNWELSTKFNIRFGFDANDTSKYIQWQCNNVGNNLWKTSATDADGVLLTVNGVTVTDPLSVVVASNMTEKFIASDVTPTASVGQPDANRNAEYPTESWIELELDKSVLADWLGVSDLPNTFWFDFGGAVYLRSIGDSGAGDLTNVTAGSGSWTTTIRYTGTELTAGEKAYYGLTTPTIPDMIVFGDEYDVSGTCTNGGNCSYTAHTATAAYLKEGTTYYHSCATCGAKGLRTFDATSSATIYTESVASDAHLASDPVCSQAATYYKSCKCGADSRNDADVANLKFGEGSALGHAYGTEWKTDSTHHWHECTRATCDDAEAKGKNNGTGSGLAEHTYDQEVASNTYLATAMTCTAPATFYKSCVCGVAGTETFTPADASYPGHKYDATDYEHDDTNHWNVCTPDNGVNCDATDNKVNITAHTYDRKVVDELYEKVNPECTIKGVYYYSCVCGAVDKSENAQTFEDELDSTVHSFGEAYVSIGTNHAQQCTRCLATGGTVAAHNYVNGKCSVCKAAQPTSGGSSVVVPPVVDTTTPVDTTAPVESDTTPVVPGTDTTPVAPGTDTAPAESESDTETIYVTSGIATEPAASESDSEADTEPADGGCGGTVSIMGLALVAALGACAVVSTKKKEEDQ